MQEARKQYVIRKLGEGKARFADALDVTHRIPTGIFVLDLSSAGGIPAGTFSVFFGRQSSGKSSAALRTIANAQCLCASCFQEMEQCACGEKRDFLCAYIDVEGSLDKSWATKLGVRLEDMLYSTPVSAEEALDTAIAYLQSDVDLLVLDTIAALEPAVELQEGLGSWQMGLQARLVTKSIRGMNAVLNEKRMEGRPVPTVLLLNQVRQSIGGTYGATEVVPGGMAQRFHAALEVRMWKGKYDYVKDDPVAVALHFEILKSKVSKPGVSGAYKLALADQGSIRVGDVIDAQEVLRWARFSNLMTKDGNGWRVGDHKFEELKDAREHYTNEKEELVFLRKDVLDAVLASDRVRDLSGIEEK